jgi:hypothetical protein
VAFPDPPLVCQVTVGNFLCPRLKAWVLAADDNKKPLAVQPQPSPATDETPTHEAEVELTATPTSALVSTNTTAQTQAAAL